MIDIDLIVETLRQHGHRVESVFSVPDNAGEYELIIGGKRMKTTDKIKSLNPSRPSEIVGIHQKAGKEHVEPAMQAALKAFESAARYSSLKRAAHELNVTPAAISHQIKALEDYLGIKLFRRMNR